MATNVGGQTVNVKFFDGATNAKVNAIGLTVRKTGIYSGALLTRTSDVAVTVSTPFVCEIADYNGTAFEQVAISVAGSPAGTAVPVAVTSGTPLVVLRWTYTGSATADYLAFTAIANGTQAATDLVVGLCTFSGTTLTGFDYSTRSNPNIFDLFLKVEPTTPASKYLHVYAGRVNYGTANYDIPDQLSPQFSPPVAGTRTDALQVNTSGALIITQNVPVAGYGGLVTLAEVTLTSGMTQIAATNIKDVRNFVAGAVPPNTYVDLTTNQTVAGIKTFSSFAVTPSSAPTTNYQTANKKYVDDSITTAQSGDVLLTGDQSVAGVKTFASFPITPSSAPSTNYQVANKKYVDDAIANDNAVLLSGDQSVSGVKTFASFPVLPGSNPTSAYQATNKTYVDGAVSTAIGTAVLLTTDQSVAGIKTFSSFPVTPTAAPSTNYQVANKKYVDDAVTNDNAVLLSGDQSVAGIKTFSSFPVTPSSAPSTSYQTANKKYIDDLLAAGAFNATYAS